MSPSPPSVNDNNVSTQLVSSRWQTSRNVKHVIPHILFSILSPLDRESPHEAAEHPEAGPGHGFRHGGDVLGDLGVGETLRGQHQQLGEDGEGQVHQLDV